MLMQPTQCTWSDSCDITDPPRAAVGINRHRTGAAAAAAVRSAGRIDEAHEGRHHVPIQAKGMAVGES